MRVALVDIAQAWGLTIESAFENRNVCVMADNGRIDCELTDAKIVSLQSSS